MQINIYTDDINRTVRTGDITKYLNQMFGNIVECATVESVHRSEDSLRDIIENMCQNATQFSIPDYCWITMKLINGETVVFEAQIDTLNSYSYLLLARDNQPKNPDTYEHIQRNVIVDSSRNISEIDVTSEIRFILGDNIRSAKLYSELNAENATEKMMRYLTEYLDSEYDFTFDVACWLEIEFDNNIRVKIISEDNLMKFEIIQYG